MTMATAVKARVPMMVEKIPPVRPICRGESRKKFRLRRGKPSLNTWNRIQIITARVEKAAAHINPLANP